MIRIWKTCNVGNDFGKFCKTPTAASLDLTGGPTGLVPTALLTSLVWRPRSSPMWQEARGFWLVLAQNKIWEFWYKHNFDNVLAFYKPRLCWSPPGWYRWRTCRGGRLCRTDISLVSKICLNLACKVFIYNNLANKAICIYHLPPWISHSKLRLHTLSPASRVGVRGCMLGLSCELEGGDAANYLATPDVWAIDWPPGASPAKLDIFQFRAQYFLFPQRSSLSI